ncbi:MAG: Rieske 2Fe-2S domain-containing protein [Actinomycetia bacterium]|nr:Rieske 2Fe-2S domain-containing protein [Actinomycetes bacterium]
MTAEPTLTPSAAAGDASEQTTAARTAKRTSLHPSAMREEIPADGYREYWYPGVLQRSVGRKRPKTVKITGIDVVFFRGEHGAVAAVADACPHRGGALSMGRCEFPGTITCPYHGWTFGGDGECRAVLGEGPESRIPGMPEARVRTYPTKTLKGVVWVWMGEDAPAPLEEDIPPQFFDDGLHVQNSVTMWKCNWRPACENMLDAHVYYVHRTSIFLLMTPTHMLLNLSKLGPRRPRPKVVNGRAVAYRAGDVATTASDGLDDAKAPGESGATWPSRNSYREAYPELGGQRWPRDSWRLPWHRVADVILKLRPVPEPLVKDLEWHDFHMPGTFQADYSRFLYSRLTVPIDSGTSRIFYFHTTRRRGTLRDWWDTAYFTVFHNWMMNYNFSGQDLGAVEPLHYDTPEHLSATDVFPLTIRRLMVENARRPAAGGTPG